MTSHRSLRPGTGSRPARTAGAAWRLRSRLEDAVVAGVLALVERAPERWARASARLLGSLLYALNRGRRRGAVARARAQLGLSSRAARSIVRDSYRNLALNAVEPRLVERRLEQDGLDAVVRIEGLEHLEAVAGEACLLCGAHFGAWELLPLVMSRLGRPIWAVAKPTRNPFLAARLSARRRRFVRGLVGHHEVQRVAALLRRGESVGIMLDQRARRGGIRLPFLGTPASQHRVAGILARRLGVRCLPVYAVRQRGDVPYRLVVEPPIAADPRLATAAAEAEVVQRLSLSLETLVRAHPGQWLWMHNRWRGADRGRSAEAAVVVDPLPSTTG